LMRLKLIEPFQMARMARQITARPDRSRLGWWP